MNKKKSSSSLDSSLNSNNLSYSNKESDSSNAFSSSLLKSQIKSKRNYLLKFDTRP